MRKMRWAILAFGVVLVAAFDARALLTPADVPRMSVGELRQRMGSPDLVIIDVRIPREWDESAKKIKGAVREDPTDLESWAAKYPPDKTLVFYCD